MNKYVSKYYNICKNYIYNYKCTFYKMFHWVELIRNNYKNELKILLQMLFV